MPVSVLVEGMDLTGKTTLARLLAAELAQRGCTTHHHRGFLARHHPMRRSLDRCQPGRRPSSRLLNAAFIAGSLLDRVLPGVLTSDRSDVIIQESYVDRAIAYGVAEGGWQASTVAAHRPDLFVSFDLAVLMHAPLAVRRTRFAARSDATAVDTRTVRDADFEEAFRSTLQRVAGRHREILWADSATRAARDTAVEIAEHVARMAHGVPAGGRR